MGLFKKAYANVSSGIDSILITHDVKRAASEANVTLGIVQVFVPHANSALALIENEASVIEAYKKWIEVQVPVIDEKRPERKSGSGRNHAHLQAQLLKQSISIPFADSKLQLGPWQEVFLFDFDDKAGRREYFILVSGESPAKQQN